MKRGVLLGFRCVDSWSGNGLGSKRAVKGGCMRADLTGAETCSAAGITTHGITPVLALCRRLLEAGHDPATRLEVYRGATLALTVRTIGEGAKLSIGGGGVRFSMASGLLTASPMRQIEDA